MITRMIPTLVLGTSLLAACGHRPPVSTLEVPPGGPRNAQEMVNNWDSKKSAEVRCSWEQAGRQIGVDGNQNKTKTVTPACGDYKP